jgi:hypothetical protein
MAKKDDANRDTRETFARATADRIVEFPHSVGVYADVDPKRDGAGTVLWLARNNDIDDSMKTLLVVRVLTSVFHLDAMLDPMFWMNLYGIARMEDDPKHSELLASGETQKLMDSLRERVEKGEEYDGYE